jgi:hypothetical protein
MNIENQSTLAYKKKGKRLVVKQDDVYNYYIDSVVGVFFELKDKDALSYKMEFTDGQIRDMGEFQRIKGSNGKSGEPNIFGIHNPIILGGIVRTDSVEEESMKAKLMAEEGYFDDVIGGKLYYIWQITDSDQIEE